MHEEYGRTVGTNKIENPLKHFRCGNCCDLLKNGLGVSTILTEDENSGSVSRVNVSEATAYIYGISVEELQDISENTSYFSDFDKNLTGISFCFQCAELLSENYKAHKRFEVGRQQLFKCIYGDGLATLSIQAGKSKANFVLNSFNDENDESQNSNDHFEDFCFSDDRQVSDCELDIEEKFETLNTNKELQEAIVQPYRKTTVPKIKELFITLYRLSEYEIKRFCGYKTKDLSRRQLDLIPKSEDNNSKSTLQTENNIDKTVMCSICQDVLETPKDFLVHLMKMHRDIKSQPVKLKVPCKYCGKLIAPSKIRFHLRTHSGNANELKVTCDICKMPMKNVKALYDHIKSMHGEKRECEICKQLTYSSRMDVHKQIYHMNVNVDSSVKVKCEICQKLFGQGYMFTHMKRHEDAPVACKTCGKMSKNTPSLERHMVIKHIDSVSCRICKKELTMFTLKDHIAEKHENKVYKCEYCSKTFTTKTGRYLHAKLHLNPKSYKEGKNKPRKLKKSNKLQDEKIECEICKKSINSERMDIHKQMKHSEDKNVKVNCKVCGKLQNSSYLPIHMRIHEDAPVNCDLCGKLVKNPFTLKRHMDFAHGASVCCIICKKEMVVAALKKHIGRKHPLQPTIYKCEHCPKEFMSKFGYDLHVNAHLNPEAHEEKLKIRKLKRKSVIQKCTNKAKRGSEYICERCGKVLTTKNGLRAHERSHTAEKEFICHLCPKKFTSKGTLEMHLQTHSAEKQFKCDECGKMFQHKHYLSQHKLNHKEVAKNGEKSVTCEECGKFFKHSLSLYKHKARYHRTDIKTNICKYCGQRFPFPKVKNKHENKCNNKPVLNFTHVV